MNVTAVDMNAPQRYPDFKLTAKHIQHIKQCSKSSKAYNMYHPQTLLPIRRRLEDESIEITERFESQTEYVFVLYAPFSS